MLPCVLTTAPTALIEEVHEAALEVPASKHVISWRGLLCSGPTCGLPLDIWLAAVNYGWANLSVSVSVSSSFSQP